jgi:hypothetical protein
MYKGVGDARVFNKVCRHELPCSLVARHVRNLEAYCIVHVTYSACVLACRTCCAPWTDHLGEVPVYKHTEFDGRFSLVDNQYISGADVAMKNTSIVSLFVSCNVRQNTVIHR